MYLDHSFFCDFCSTLMDTVFENDERIIFRCQECGMLHTEYKRKAGGLF